MVWRFLSPDRIDCSMGYLIPSSHEMPSSLSAIKGLKSVSSSPSSSASSPFPGSSASSSLPGFARGPAGSTPAAAAAAAGSRAARPLAPTGLPAHWPQAVALSGTLLKRHSYGAGRGNM